MGNNNVCIKCVVKCKNLELGCIQVAVFKKKKDFFKESLPLTGAQAFGDGQGVCCRLCGGDRNLHGFYETYTNDGVEQRYGQLVFDCFGIQVRPTDGMICDKCVYQIHMTQRFRSLVVAAFAVPNKLPSNSKIDTHDDMSKNHIKHKSNVDLIKKSTKTNIEHKRRYQRKSMFNLNVQQKRMNLSCASCRQRYPMLVPFEGWKNFICSRCKKTNVPRPNVIKRGDLSANNIKGHWELRARTDLRGKSRLFSLPKKPSQMSRNDLVTSKYQLQPARRLSRNLTHNSRQNVNDTHCDVCGKDFRSVVLLERHTRIHSGTPLYRCDVCGRVFKEKNSFQSHYLGHGK